MIPSQHQLTWSFSDLEAFRAVVHHGSFAAAARSLGHTRSAISKATRRLEDALELQLFVRTTRQVSLTDAGRVFHGHACALLDGAREASAALDRLRERPAGVLRVSAPVSLGLDPLVGWFADFLTEHPQIELDLSLNSRVIDPYVDSFDLALRVSSTPELPDSELRARKLATGRMILCASPAYLERRTTPAAPDDLSQHDCLAYAHNFGPDRRGSWRFGEVLVSFTPRLRSDSGVALRRAALEGLGLAMLPSFLCARELDAGCLVELLEDQPPRHFTVYSISPPAVYRARALDVLLDFLATRFADTESRPTR